MVAALLVAPSSARRARRDDLELRAPVALIEGARPAAAAAGVELDRLERAADRRLGGGPGHWLPGAGNGAGTVRAGGDAAVTRRALDAALAARPTPPSAPPGGSPTAGAPSAGTPTATPTAAPAAAAGAPAERAAADAARIRAQAATDPAGAAAELERCIDDSPDPAYRAALLAHDDTRRALQEMGAGVGRDADTASAVTASLARVSTTLRAGGQVDAAQAMARDVSAGLVKQVNRSGVPRHLEDTIAATVEGGGADLCADLTEALAATPSRSSAATQRLTRAVATGLAQGVDRLGRELDARSEAYDHEITASNAQAQRYAGVVSPEEGAAAADAAATRAADAGAQADAQGAAYYASLEAASRARDALHQHGHGAVADRDADLDGQLAAGASRLPGITRFPAGAAAVGATLRREQAGERTLVDSLDGLGLDAEVERRVFGGWAAAAAFNGVQDVAAGRGPAGAADQLRDLGQRFLPAGEAAAVSRTADRLAEGSLLTPEGLAELDGAEPFASDRTLRALALGVAGASQDPAQLAEAVRSGRIPPEALQATTILMSMVAIEEGHGHRALPLWIAGNAADAGSAVAHVAGASGASAWLRGLGKALGGAGDVVGFFEAVSRGDDVTAGLCVTSLLGALPGLGPLGWLAGAGMLGVTVYRSYEHRIEVEEADIQARIRFLREAGVPCAEELGRLSDGGVAVLERVRASGPHPDLEAAIRAEIAREYVIAGQAAAVSSYGM